MADFKKPVVSICIPTYNGARYLCECLDSVLGQTFTDFEVLLVDDLSSDESVSVAHAYAKLDKRVMVHRNERNLGLVGNWNRCVELARGEWIKFVFQDDLVEAGCLERMLEAGSPDAGIVACRRNLIFENVSDNTREGLQSHINRFAMEKIFPGKTEISARDVCSTAINFIGKNFIGEPTAVLLHRSVFTRFGVFNPHMVQICDLEFWIRVASHTGLVYVPETLAQFRVHDASMTALNLALRKYQKVTSDEMVMLHDFAFHPLYAPLRDVAAIQEPPVNLKDLLAVRIKELKKAAVNLANDPVDPDRTLTKHMQVLTGYYPIFALIRKMPFSRTLALFSWKLRIFIRNLGLKR